MNEFLGQKCIVFGDRAIPLPYRIHQIMTVGDRVLINLYGDQNDFDESRSADPVIVANARKKRELLNTGVWCFDQEGNLLWKIAEAYPETVQEKELAETGHRFFAEYVGFEYDPNDGVVTGITIHGNRTRVKFSDGELLSRSPAQK